RFKCDWSSDVCSSDLFDKQHFASDGTHPARISAGAGSTFWSSHRDPPGGQAEPSTHRNLRQGGAPVIHLPAEQIANLYRLSPEIILCVFGMIIMVVDAFLEPSNKRALG